MIRNEETNASGFGRMVSVPSTSELRVFVVVSLVATVLKGSLLITSA